MSKTLTKITFFLLPLALALSLIGCGGSTPTPELPDLYIRLSFINNSGLNANRIYVTINGYNRSNQWGFFDLSKEPAEFVVTSDLADVPEVTLDTLIARGGLIIPYVVSGRVYLGIDQAIGAEAADFTTPNSPTGKIYDKFELTVKETGNVVNLTQVDYFNLPLKLSSATETRGFNDGITRQQIFEEYLAAQSGGWEKLVLRDASNNFLRILNPAKIAPADAAFFSELYSYWDELIEEFWANGRAVTILTDENVPRVISGTANGAQIDYGPDGAYLKPSSLQLFGQEVAAGSNAAIVKWISGAINRGVIKNATVADQGDSTKFYSASSASNAGLFNKYAEFFHDSRYTIDGRAYALAFDDVFGRDSALGIANKGSATVQLQPFE